MKDLPIVDDDHVDDGADEEIQSCLTKDKPTSFFLFAGAGSGKTRSLVDALRKLRKIRGKQLRLHGHRVGVITYTNAACDEIKQRLEYDSLIEVSTIHSFIWSLICTFHVDIKVWVENNLKIEIAELEEQGRKGRAGTKAALDREKSIEVKNKRLANLDGIKRFTYNPNGDNRGEDSLNHSEVIKIGAEFIEKKPLMQMLLISKFPVLLIDESQDTNRLLMEAFLAVQRQHCNHFVLGLFGDTMQRIYGDGKVDLGENLPSNWAKPAKVMNHRCPKRVIRLINRIRVAVDSHEQKPRGDKEEGFVRLFVVSGNGDKARVEFEVSKQMEEITGDSHWVGDEGDVKTLTLEHHMAAQRMGFFEMFEPLYQVDSLKTGLLDGTLPGLPLFSQHILPLIKAKQKQDDFAVTAVVRENSPLLSKAALKSCKDNQTLQIQLARDAVEAVFSLWAENINPSFKDVLMCIAKTGLFEIPESLLPFVLSSKEAINQTQPELPDDEESPVLDAWRKFLETPFQQIEAYSRYINGFARFGTHQGVKGLEFPRVKVIVDDNEAKGFLFAYDKLFGIKEKTKADIDNERAGKDTSIDRTRRLFYVTCSRAMKSLAIVAYTSNPTKLRDHVLREGWFEDNEVIHID